MVIKKAPGIKTERINILEIRKLGTNETHDVFSSLHSYDYDSIMLMIPTREIVNSFRHLSQDRLNIIIEIHNIVADVSPNATVEIRRYGIVYYDAARGGPVTAGICQTLLKPDHVRLAFIHGAYLPDPQHKLVGDTFPKRYLSIHDFNGAPWEYIEHLIKVHSQFDPRSINHG